jgi:hypothetical protein
VRHSCPYLRHYPRICVEELRKCKKISIIRRPDRDLNPRPSEYDSKPGGREAFEITSRNNFVPRCKHLFMILHLFTAHAPTPFTSLFLLVLLKHRTRTCMALEHHYLILREGGLLGNR